MSATGSTPFAHKSAQSPLASDVSGFGTEATDPDYESRPVTKQEFTRFRRRAEKTFQHMYADVMGLLKREVEEQNRLREDLKLMMVGRMETLTDYTPGGAEEKLTELHDNMVVVTDTLGDKLQTLEDMVLAVSTMAEEAVAKLSKDLE